VIALEHECAIDRREFARGSANYRSCEPLPEGADRAVFTSPLPLPDADLSGRETALTGAELTQLLLGRLHDRNISRLGAA
jgi:hypothetical protein